MTTIHTDAKVEGLKSIASLLSWEERRLKRVIQTYAATPDPFPAAKVAGTWTAMTSCVEAWFHRQTTQRLT